MKIQPEPIHRSMSFQPRKYEKTYGEELDFHEQKCHTIFDNIKNGASIYINVEQNTLEEIEENGTQYVRMSILSDEILSYDIETFRIEGREEILNRYRPYFVSFIVPIRENKLKNIYAVGENWHEAKFINNEETVVEEGILLQGTLETSASPINCIEGKLLVFQNKAMKKEVLDKINNTYDPYKFPKTDSKEIEKILNDAWSKDFPNTIDIYNIGHGNADYIRGAKHRILYDIGYNYRSFPSYNNSKYLKAVRSIRQLRPSCVILSHWDLDHIIGCAYAKQNIFCKKWIAPHLVSGKDKKASTNAIRLAHYLWVLGNLCLVDREQTNKLIATIPCRKNAEMKLWLGDGNTTTRINRKNREGLIIQIYDKNNNLGDVLLAGDVPYQSMPDILKRNIDFMHVPHHCSKMELARLSAVPTGGIAAVISTNRNTDGDINCDEHHHDELEKKFCEVVNTIDNNTEDDEANLSVQIKWVKQNYRFRQ